MSMEAGHDRLEVLDRAECLMLLRGVPIGRVGLTIEGKPSVLPVNFVIDDGHDRLVIRTTEGGKYAGAIDGQYVAFEADEFDPLTHAGWSVVVRGHLGVVTNAADVRRLEHLPLQAWAGSAMPHWVVLGMDEVTGRRVAGWRHHGVHGW